MIRTVYVLSKPASVKTKGIMTCDARGETGCEVGKGQGQTQDKGFMQQHRVPVAPCREGDSALCWTAGCEPSTSTAVGTSSIATSRRRTNSKHFLIRNKLRKT